MIVTVLVAGPVAAFSLAGLLAPQAGTMPRAAGVWILLGSNRDGKMRAYGIRPDGSRLTPLLPPARTLTPEAVSRDGRTIAYGDRLGAIYVSRADGTGLHRLVRGGFGEVFSRDGSRLAYTHDGGVSIIGTGGRGRRRLTSQDVSIGDFDLSPNGKALVYLPRPGPGPAEALILQPLHGKRRVLDRTNFERDDQGLCCARWSPDGRWIAYWRGDDFQASLWLVRPDGTRRHRVASPSATFAWSPDSKKLAFTGDSGVAVTVVGVDGRKLRRVPLADVRSIGTLNWSPDGRQFVFEGRSGGDTTQIWTVGVDGTGLQRLTSAGENSLVGWTRLAPVLPQAPELAPTERVLAADTVATRAPVALLSADGPSVAFVAKATATDCPHVAVWTPGEASIRRLGPLPAPCSVEPARISDLALAGSRAAWAANQPYGRDSCEYMLTSATLADSKPLALTFHAGAPCNVQDYHHLRGHGDLLVFNDGARLVRIGTGREQCEEQGQSTPATICATVRRGAHAAPVESVSGGLIAIREPGAVAVLDAQGTLVRVFPFTRADVSGVRLDGSSLVVLRFGVLDVYEVATGVRQLSRPLPTGYRLADVDGGIAVLLSADRIMLVRLGDGHSLTLTSGLEATFADLESPGLYGSYATGDGGGRIVFVPRSELLRQLG